MVQIKIGIIGGSGLDDPDILLNRDERKVTTVFGDPSDVLIEGLIGNVPCILLARHGRGHSIVPGKVNYRANIWALKEAGCTHIIASTASGSLQQEIEPGSILIPDSFIDRTQGRAQSFYDGEPGHPVGVCHVPMEPAFCELTRKVVISCAAESNIKVHPRGTIVTIEGPRFSSKAESNMHRTWGASLVNMTTVPEVVLAKEAGICYAAIAMATDYDCWQTTGEKVSVDAALARFKENASTVVKLIKAVVLKIGSEKWDDAICDLKGTIVSSVMLPK